MAKLAWLLNQSPPVLINLEQRSAEENRYYWGVVVPMLARVWRLTKPAAHARIKDQFTGGVSTATLTTVSFEQLMDRLRGYAARRHGIQIPLPHSSGGGNFNG